jgi:hypothetical protein
MEDAGVGKNWDNFKHRFKDTALIGPLVECTRRDHASALKELMIIATFSTITFWLSALVLKMLDVNRSAGYFELLFSTVKGGELFIFAVAIMGPILIIVSDETPTRKIFPAGTWLNFGLVVVALICGTLYGIMRVANFQLGSLQLNQSLLYDFSLYMACAAVFFRYLAIVYNKGLSQITPEELLMMPEHQFVNSFAARHKDDNQ